MYGCKDWLAAVLRETTSALYRTGSLHSNIALPILSHVLLIRRLVEVEGRSPRKCHEAEQSAYSSHDRIPVCLSCIGSGDSAGRSKVVSGEVVHIGTSQLRDGIREEEERRQSSANTTCDFCLEARA